MNIGFRSPITIRVFQFTILALFFTFLELGVTQGFISPLFVSAPSHAILSLTQLLFRERALSYLYDTISSLFSAFILSSIVGISLGLLIGTYRLLRQSFEPIIAALFSIPKVLFVPIFWSLLGFGQEFKIFFSMFHGVIPVILNIMAQMVTVETLYVKVAKSFGAGLFQLYRKVYLPSVVFSLLLSLRIGFNLCFVGVIVAELFVGTNGLGYLLRTFASNFSIPEFYAIVYLVLILNASVNILLLSMERRLVKVTTL